MNKNEKPVAGLGIPNHLAILAHFRKHKVLHEGEVLVAVGAGMVWAIDGVDLHKLVLKFKANASRHQMERNQLA